MTMQNDPQAAFIESAHALRSRISSPGSATKWLPSGPAVDGERRRRALNTCHRYAAGERLSMGAPKDSGAYVPEMSARLEDDPHLTDGARRCARKMAELTYRQNREGRVLPVTVTYLARALGRCRRTVQRYLRQLEVRGYVAVDVVASPRSRMCIGLMVRLLTPLLAAHHRQSWPEKAGKSGATRESLNHRFKLLSQGKAQQVPVQQWAMRCMDGVFRSLMKTNPLAGLPPVCFTP